MIEGDLFGIANRLKSIDESYFIVYSYRRRRFEVHSSAQRGNTLALVLPYDRLDERTVRLVLETRVQRRKEFFAEMERANAALEKSEREKQIKKLEKEVEHAYGKI